MNELSSHRNAGKGDKDRSPGWRKNYHEIDWGTPTVCGEFKRVGPGRIRKVYAGSRSGQQVDVISLEERFKAFCETCERHAGVRESVKKYFERHGEGSVSSSQEKGIHEIIDAQGEIRVVCGCNGKEETGAAASAAERATTVSAMPQVENRVVQSGRCESGFDGPRHAKTS